MKREFVTMEQLEYLRGCDEIINIEYTGISIMDYTSKRYEIYTVFKDHYTLYVK